MRKIMSIVLSMALCLALIAGLCVSASAAQVVPAEGPALVYPVANAIVTGAVTSKTNAGVTYLDYGNNRTGVSVAYKVTVDHAGGYYLGLLYNLGSNTVRYLDVTVNNGAAQHVEFLQNSAGWGDNADATKISWNNQIIPVTLAKGENTIVFAPDGTNGSPQISDLTVWTVEEWLTYADNPTVSGTTMKSVESVSGFDGYGYDMGNAVGTVSWDVNITVPGTYKFSVAYSTPSTATTRPIEVVVDGAVVASMVRAKNSNGYGRGWGLVTTEEIALDAGATTVAMQAAGSAQISALRLELVKADIPEGQMKDLTVNYDQATAPGTVYSLDVTWENDDFTFDYAGGSQGNWNPADHTFSDAAEAGWEDDDVKVTVVNHSNTAVKVTMDITDADADDNLAVTSDKATETLATAEGTAVENAPTVVYTLTITGTPTANVTKVATATLSISGVE